MKPSPIHPAHLIHAPKQQFITSGNTATLKQKTPDFYRIERVLVFTRILNV